MCVLIYVCIRFCWCNVSARCVSGDFHFLYRSSSVMDSF
uniref:Uncharacterized protein n=1 Tax=Anguilla anguilla TaxID=7936 RepID=A0A0E9VMG9_ANGAN